MAKLGNISGYKPMEATGTAREQLPADTAFIAKILGVKLEENDYGTRMIIRLEITEGEYKGFFKKDYDAQAGGQYEQRYHGDYRLNVPTDKSKFYDSDLRRFNSAIGAIEASNKGFSFADSGMDTDALKGKAVAFLTREAEYNDRTYTEIGMLLSVDRAKAGKFKPMQKRGGNQSAQTSAPAPVPTVSAFASASDDDDIPF